MKLKHRALINLGICIVNCLVLLRIILDPSRHAIINEVVGMVNSVSLLLNFPMFLYHLRESLKIYRLRESLKK